MSRILLTAVSLLVISSASAAESARDIVVKSVSADHNNMRLASHYTFRERLVEKEFDSTGRAKSSKETAQEFLFLGGKPYEHLIEKDDKPLPPDQAKKEQAKLDKAAAEAARLTDAEREKRLADNDAMSDAEHQRERLSPISRAPDGGHRFLSVWSADRRCGVAGSRAGDFQ